MTDRHSGYLVTLAEDIRGDEAQDIITALEQIRGVAGVQPVEGGIENLIGQQRADAKWREQIARLLSYSSASREGLA